VLLRFIIGSYTVEAASGLNEVVKMSEIQKQNEDNGQIQMPENPIDLVHKAQERNVWFRDVTTGFAPVEIDVVYAATANPGTHGNWRKDRWRVYMANTIELFIKLLEGSIGRDSSEAIRQSTAEADRDAGEEAKRHKEEGKKYLEEELASLKNRKAVRNHKIAIQENEIQLTLRYRLFRIRKILKEDTPEFEMSCRYESDNPRDWFTVLITDSAPLLENKYTPKEMIPKFSDFIASGFIDSGSSRENSDQENSDQENSDQENSGTTKSNYSQSVRLDTSTESSRKDVNEVLRGMKNALTVSPAEGATSEDDAAKLIVEVVTVVDKMLEKEVSSSYYFSRYYDTITFKTEYDGTNSEIPNKIIEVEMWLPEPEAESMFGRMFSASGYYHSMRLTIPNSGSDKLKLEHTKKENRFYSDTTYTIPSPMTAEEYVESVRTRISESQSANSSDQQAPPSPRVNTDEHLPGVSLANNSTAAGPGSANAPGAASTTSIPAQNGSAATSATGPRSPTKTGAQTGTQLNAAESSNQEVDPVIVPPNNNTRTPTNRGKKGKGFLKLLTGEGTMKEKATRVLKTATILTVISAAVTAGFFAVRRFFFSKKADVQKDSGKGAGKDFAKDSGKDSRKDPKKDSEKDSGNKNGANQQNEQKDKTKKKKKKASNLTSENLKNHTQENSKNDTQGNDAGSTADTEEDEFDDAASDTSENFNPEIVESDWLDASDESESEEEEDGNENENQKSNMMTNTKRKNFGDKKRTPPTLSFQPVPKRSFTSTKVKKNRVKNSSSSKTDDDDDDDDFFYNSKKVSNRKRKKRESSDSESNLWMYWTAVVIGLCVTTVVLLIGVCLCHGRLRQAKQTVSDLGSDKQTPPGNLPGNSGTGTAGIATDNRSTGAANASNYRGRGSKAKTQSRGSIATENRRTRAEANDSDGSESDHNGQENDKISKSRNTSGDTDDMSTTTHTPSATPNTTPNSSRVNSPNRADNGATQPSRTGNAAANRSDSVAVSRNGSAAVSRTPTDTAYNVNFRADSGNFRADIDYVDNGYVDMACASTADTICSGLPTLLRPPERKSNDEVNSSKDGISQNEDVRFWSAESIPRDTIRNGGTGHTVQNNETRPETGGPEILGNMRLQDRFRLFQNREKPPSRVYSI